MTATRHPCVPNTLHTATMHANVDEPRTPTAGYTRQREVADDGAGLNGLSRRYQFLMSFLRVMSACHA